MCLPEKEIRFNNGDLLANTRKINIELADYLLFSCCDQTARQFREERVSLDLQFQREESQTQQRIRKSEELASLTTSRKQRMN